MDKTFDAEHLDVAAFAQAQAQLQGSTPLTQWPRLLEEQMPDHPDALSIPSVHWRLHGQMLPVSGAAPRVALQVWACVDLSMQCQRCLTPFVQTVQAQQTFIFVADEATAAALDDEAQEDVLVLSRDFNAVALIEDELILALPLMPHHEVCPLSLPQQAMDEGFDAASERPHPFAALAALKKPV